MPSTTRLREVREQCGYSRKDLAKELKIPYSTLTNYENGTRRPPYTFLLDVAQYFGITVDYLLGYSDTPKVSNVGDGVWGVLELERSVYDLLENIGIKCDVCGRRYYLTKIIDAQDTSVRITGDERERLFDSIVEFSTYAATSLFNKAKERGNTEQQSDQ